jgi:DNA-binding CsgD family transcriptional regulator
LKVHIRSIYRKYDISNRKSLIELIEQKTGSRAAG